MLAVCESCTTVCLPVDLDDNSSSESSDFSKVEHSGPVLSVDVCHKLEIFATCRWVLMPAVPLSVVLVACFT